MPARIIFRSPNTWNSSFWINVGKEANRDLSQPILAKNSPVLVGDSVVGVVDYVGSYQSRVRLITDSGLVPSVRVARGDEQTKAIAENVSDLLAYLSIHPELTDQTGKTALENGLRNLQQKLIEKNTHGIWLKGKSTVKAILYGAQMVRF
ncbi:MAG: hypothetical protein HWD61_09565 [Parachlamydiaceae bacterium]|nr:MAG: hypothetical protein HWD61_09565 [Parachlamydiaceae bacterium]